MMDGNCSLLTLIPTGVTFYGSHYFKVKFLKKVNNLNLKINYPQAICIIKTTWKLGF
jgi:hypothetical protein